MMFADHLHDVAADQEGAQKGLRPGSGEEIHAVAGGLLHADERR